MRIILLWLLSFCSLQASHGQAMSAEHLFSLCSVPPSKLDKRLAEKGFAFSGRDLHKDSSLRQYEYRRTRYFRDVDSITRSVTRTDIGGQALITYRTASADEYFALKKQLQAAGLFTSHDGHGDSTASLVFQRNDRCVRTSVCLQDTITMYSLQFEKKCSRK